MQADAITEQLNAKGIRQIDVVTRLGMPRTSRTIVSLVIHGMARSRRVEAEIASILERPLEEVFPTWYGRTPKKVRPARRQVA